MKICIGKIGIGHSVGGKGTGRLIATFFADGLLVLPTTNSGELIFEAVLTPSASSRSGERMQHIPADGRSTRARNPVCSRRPFLGSNA